MGGSGCGNRISGANCLTVFDTNYAYLAQFSTRDHWTDKERRTNRRQQQTHIWPLKQARNARNILHYNLQE